jgi:hypothetical protein
MENRQNPVAFSQATYITASLPAEGFVGIDLLINQPPRKDRPGRIGVFGIGRSKYYELIRAGAIPLPKKIGRKSLMDVATVRQVLTTLAQDSTTQVQ